ncbi:MAG: hypothetical protein WCO59_02020 [Actinomycetes bacterium]
MAGLIPPQLSVSEQQLHSIEQIADRLRLMDLTRLSRTDAEGLSIAEHVYQSCCRLTDRDVPRLSDAAAGDQWMVIAREYLSDQQGQSTELLDEQVRAVKSLL